MSTQPATTEKTGVILLRMAIGKEEVDVPVGATLADLLHLAGVDTQDQELLIDGKPLEECLVLRPGVIVSVGPKRNPPRRSWSDTVGMLRDDPRFE